MNETQASAISDRITTRGRGQMRAVVQHSYGPAESLGVAEIPRPEIGPDEVEIEVHAAGVDRGVWHLMVGLPYLVRLMGYGLTAPKNPVPGLDVAGRVTAVGAEVSRFVVGDEVFGVARGAYAEYAAAEEGKIAHKPAGLSFEEAAVVPISGVTALQALTDVGRIEPGQSVLVIGASGGVGSYAVQLAKASGATVTGVASAAKSDMVRSLGADHVIDYATADYLDGTARYDLIVDIGGGNTLRRLRRALTADGTLVIVGAENGGRWTGGIGRQLRAVALSPFLSQRLAMMIAAEDHAHIERMARHIEQGDVVPAVGRRYSLDDAPRALRDLEAGMTSGKSVIVVRGEVTESDS